MAELVRVSYIKGFFLQQVRRDLRVHPTPHKQNDQPNA